MPARRFFVGGFEFDIRFECKIDPDSFALCSD
ncbi:MAG TPA: hypothetical protein DEB17_08770 [Chlorobaculum sp.]|uniref:Uncharacterized protein n=1 Tax=Chlorobaculum tepidum (strain ATCC 49652 / DSM 12025 / NBRC 103806 / TLS) TaxID=194439 RepID=Q8KEV3_CHLTE|nr:hypothetical protein CT0579 [Chlorobaculum tepidum TLS]HBU24059.1 hypothetical protein [Chlorobaculum sp.]